LLLPSADACWQAAGQRRAAAASDNHLVLLLLFGCALCCQVLTLAGELLGNAEVLLRDGLHTSEIADGYQRASDKASAGLKHIGPCIVGHGQEPAFYTSVVACGYPARRV
jgi:hypothetical protein